MQAKEEFERSSWSRLAASHAQARRAAIANTPPALAHTRAPAARTSVHTLA
jgi:hypothetical protein